MRTGKQRTAHDDGSPARRAFSVTEYLRRVDPEEPFHRLLVANIRDLQRNITHVADDEAMGRDRIVLETGGEAGSTAIVECSGVLRDAAATTPRGNVTYPLSKGRFPRLAQEQVH